MRSLKAVRTLVLTLAATLLLVAGLAACGGSAGGGNVSAGGGGNAGAAGSGGNAGGGTVTGTVTWPDGNPAANAWVYFNDHETGFSGSGWSQHDSANSWYQLQLPADGSYSLPGCPCAYLTAYLRVPASVMQPANGGWDCWIIMQDDSQNYQGRQANPDDVINWQALGLPCSPTFYTSDPGSVQSVPSASTSGTWQAAEQLASGG